MPLLLAGGMEREKQRGKRERLQISSYAPKGEGDIDDQVRCAIR